MGIRKILRWALPALVVVAALVAIRPSDGGLTARKDGLTYAAGALQADLESRSRGPATRIVADFALPDGTRCRAFARTELSGVACRRDDGWHLRIVRDGVSLDDPGATAAIDRGLRAAAARLARQ